MSTDSAWASGKSAICTDPGLLTSAFRRGVWHELFEAGRITYHPVFPGRPGFGARAIESDDDVADVIALMRLNYDRGVANHGLPG